MANILDVPKQVSVIAVLYNGNVLICYSTKQAVIYCEKMRLRITNTFTEGATYFIEAQREDSSL